MKPVHMEPANFVAPVCVSSLPARERQLVKSGIGLITINFNTGRQTLRCVESLRHSTIAPDWVLVLDNASNEEDVRILQAELTDLAYSEVRLYRSEINMGFAAGSNFLIHELLKTAECQFVMMLNNDAVAMPKMLEELINALGRGERPAGLAGGRMHKLAVPDEVDTLGIALYASLMPADRKTLDDPFLGPTGGCCLMTRQIIEHLLEVSGYCFDPRFFCYCEDTDMVLRSLMLGYNPCYTDELIALHEGQASSNKANNFITYHGLRNAIWMHLKLFSGKLILRHGLMLAVAHLMSVARHSIQGNGRTVLRIYLDAWLGRKQFLTEHKYLAKSGIQIGINQTRLMSKKFYRAKYLKSVVKEITRHKISLR